MVINANGVSIEGLNFGAINEEEIYQNLKILYTTNEGTVPFDRLFGINVDLLDLPIPIAKGRLIAEYTAKTRQFEPRANVKSISFEIKENTLVPKVVIEIVSD